MEKKSKSSPKESEPEVLDLSDEELSLSDESLNKELEDDLKQKKAPDLSEELKKSQSDLLYLRAEFDNFRKQSIKERSHMVKFGAERLVKDLLNVIDIFDTALNMEVSEENYQSFVDGVRMTSTELKNTLKNHGVESRECLGENFDPTIHEALSNEPTDKYKPGQISQVFKKLYTLHGRVIRPGQVVVASEISSKES